MKWEEVNLGDCIEFSNGFAFKSKGFTDNPNDVPLVKGENLGKGRILWEKSKYWNREELSKHEKFVLYPDDVVLAMDRPWVNGSLKYAIIREDDPTALLVQRVGRLRAKNNIHYLFLKYIVASEDFANYIKNIMGGVGVPHISPTQIQSYSFNLPPLPTQQKIASILSAYDDLIENNLRRIRLLEEAAQRIYREWFVHLRFPGYAHTPVENGLPRGWARRKIEDIIEYHIGGGWGKEEIEQNFVKPAFVIRGTDIPKLLEGDHSNVPFRYHTESNLSSRNLEVGDLVFEVSGGSKGQPVGRSLLITDEIINYFGDDAVMCASFCKLIRVNKKTLTPYYFDAYIKEIYSNGIIAQYENQSASNIINFKFNDFLTKEEIIIPETVILESFQKIIKPIRTLIGNLGLQNQNLKAARDILLPRLMNQTIIV